ncbi:MAG TPA: hypothetical protein VF498_08595, partial [Anaerolineales bacterium]
NDLCQVDRFAPIVMAGCDIGVYRAGEVLTSEKQEFKLVFELVSMSEFIQLKDSVTIPRNWLLISGNHKIQVLTDSEFASQSQASPASSGQGGSHGSG